MPVLVCSCRRIHFQPEPASGNLWFREKKTHWTFRRVIQNSDPSLISFLEVSWHSKRKNTTMAFRASKTQANLLRMQKIHKNPHLHVLPGPSLIPVHNTGGSRMTMAFQIQCRKGEGSISTIRWAPPWGWQVHPLCPGLGWFWTHVFSA